ncbi:MAG TPA: SDR family oxidoreductase [Flavobacteriales bacterium]|nr:SDR family oxidoreductase [Flavobacteriales bacterium]HQW41272.1 SDR family oxidoreductase [Flavobacteriales bacterium]
MRILLTGATGYIGKRLLPALVAEGHYVICCTRDKDRFHVPVALQDHVTVVELDFLDRVSLAVIPADIDAAYYLMHSMASSTDFQKAELRSAVNFREAISSTAAKQVIYLTGIINEDELSEHLASRKAVEEELDRGSYHLTSLRAGIIIGSGSASFEIIRDLVEKLPVMIAPIWLRTRCQPIAIRDVISFLSKSLGNAATYDRDFDIGGPGIYTYKEMLLGYAKVRGLKRWIGIVPVMTPRLSSYWLYFVTSTSYRLAVSLVDSMKVEVVCRNTELNGILGITPIDYPTALQATLQKIEGNEVVSGWTDSFTSSAFTANLSEFLQVPTFGCFTDQRSKPMGNRERTRERIWRIGGRTGWYYGNVLWRMRGFMDKLVGGVGLNRGRTHLDTLMAGDSVDFWRVLYANKEEGRLLLFAEMKLPGEAWLEFKMDGGQLQQTATFRPKGLWGRLYWYAVLPFHGLVFNGMLTKLAV